MANLYEDIQCVSSDTCPPMLDRSDFESWQQRICLYCLGKENGENILQSIDEGPIKMGKFRETLSEGAEGALHLGLERDRVDADLKPEEKERYKANICATNNLLQGSELTKDERKSQLYDDFEHFRQNKGETIHEYYDMFTMFINDMRNIKMTMPKMQLNLKFVNNMLPEWGRFVTVVKLNRGLKTSNYDQMYAYLKQNEAHANENKMMLERYNQHAIDPLAFYVKDNVVQVVQSNVSSMPNDALMMIINDMHEHNVQCVSTIEQNKVVNESLTDELARYKEQVTIYEKGQEDTLEIAEITRKKMLEKMKSPLKNLLIENEDLIADCLSNELMYSVMNDVNNVSEFSKFHDAYTVGQARCLELEAKISKLKHKIEKDDHSEMIKHFSNLEELLEYVIGTCLKEFSKRDKKVTTTPLNRKKQVTFKEPCDTSNNNTQTHVEQQKLQQTNVPVIPSTRVISSTEASGSKLRSNTKKNRYLPAKSDKKKKIEAHPRNNKSKLKQENHVVQIVLWYLDSGCSKNITGNHSRLKNFMKQFIGIVRFGNDHFGPIIGQFCDSDLEVAFRKHSCYVRDVDGVELLQGSRGSNLYTISVEDMIKSSPICLLSKASKNKSWLWHCELNHLNFSTINDLARKDLVRGLPRLKFEKDHICSACQLGKSKKYTHKPKYENIILEALHTLYMDLYIRTDNGIEFVNQVLTEFYESVGISHQKSVSRTPKQNGVVERQNRTLVEATRTMLIFSNALIFLWIEDVATMCYTQNRSLIHTRHNKTLYELVHDKKLDLTFIYIFGALCYPTNDNEDLVKLKAKADIGFFVGYAPNRKDAPSTSHSPSSSNVQPSISHQGVAAGPPFKDNPFAHDDNDPFENVFAPEPSFKESSSGDVSTADSNQIALKWIYKVKLDEYGDVLKNKAQLVAKGYRQEEGIDFEESYRLHGSRLTESSLQMTLAKT
uniref:Integrase catalytic domain-containing protein n=1 Tax=Tanacetum cinerariifolium TaxID=118510 RepID=A0A6L2MKW6_TANCI|nr:hypothetical protein [Tanacetum cinerariifolium]